MHSHSTHRARPPQRLTGIFLGLSLVFVLLIGSGAVAQESTPESTPPITITATPVDTSVPVTMPPAGTDEQITTTPAEVPADEPQSTEVAGAPEATQELLPTSDPAEAPESTLAPEAEVTETTQPTEAQSAAPEATPEPAAATTDGQPEPAPTDYVLEVQPLLVQTYCQMHIGNRGDNDPFTYTFSASYAHIASFQWSVNGSPIGTGTSLNHDFTAPGTYTITLTCTPEAGFGVSPFTLTGTVQVSSPAPVAYFTINEGTTFQQVVSASRPLTLTTNNLSTPTGLTYSWTVTPAVDCGDLTSQNLSCTITNYGTYTFELDATNSTGTSGFTQTVHVVPPPPLVDFSFTPTSGTVPPDLVVSFTSVTDAESGPVTTWEWDFDGDSTVDSTLQNPTYTYTTARPGSAPYLVKLTATGPGGTMEITRGVNVFQSGASVQAAFTMVQTDAGSTPSTVEVCFTNTSSGPITIYEWDFGDDGSFETTTSDLYFCQDFPVGFLRVRLRVSSASATSNAYRELNLLAAPVANFTYTPTTGLTQVTQIDFSDASTGIVTDYAWDFDGDGVTDSTERNPQNIQQAVGSNHVRLTVTGPGGSSSVEQIIDVARLEITCAIQGNFAPLPGELTQTYTSNIGNVAGRQVTYSWSITGGALPATSSSANFGPITFPGNGNYQITLNASTPDGSSCSDTRTVTVTYPPLVCNMTLPNPMPGYPDGALYNFTAAVTPASLAGRTVISYAWTLDGGSVGGNGASFGYTNPTTAGTHTLRYTVTASDGSTCFEEVAITTSPYPPVTCDSINGEASPIPVNTNGSQRNIQYRANLTGMVGGRTATYAWTAQGSSNTPAATNPTNVQWSLIYASNGTGTPSNVSAAVTVHTPGQPDQTVTCSRTVNVRINNLVCNAPTGDLTPVVGETNAYSAASRINNLYGRTPTITWELRDSSNAVVASGTGNTISHTFLNAGETYTVSYTAAVSSPQADSCTAAAALTVTNAGQTFACDSFPTGGSNFSPAVAGSYAYTVDIDNGNLIPLHYDYVLVGPNGNERIIGSYESNANGLVSGPNPPFTLNDLGPIGNYTLRVDVRAINPADTSYTCSLSHALVVGSLNVSFTYDNGSGGAINNSAVEVGTQICFTNTSAPVPPVPSDQNALTYTWDIGGTPNAGLPGCITFDTPGTYTVNLTGVNAFDGDASFRRTQTRSVTFNVYGSQSITITRSNEVYAPATVTFTANGTNITGAYNWTFYDEIGTVLGTRSNQQNPTFNFVNPGTYRAVVTGTGPLGSTSAELEFSLIGTNDILASFIPSQYAGVAPMAVCFTDTSVGQNLAHWEWDFGNGQTLSYDSSNIPASICTNYPMPDTDYPVSLVVTNRSNMQATASNVVRTYSVLESSATFRITPQSGGRYCFTPEVTGGIVVTGWDFGDHTTSGPVDPVCHNYQSVGDFRVVMQIEGPDGTSGSVERIVTVSLSSGTPALSASAVCAADRTATFTITNNGDAMTVADQVVVRNANGDVIDVRPVQLSASGTPGDEMVFSLPNQSGPLTLSLTDNSGVTANTTCYYPPELTASAICSNGLPVFTVTNARPNDGPMSSPQAYEIQDTNGSVVASGTFELSLGETSEIITLPPGTLVYAAYTLVSSGAAGTFSVSQSCDAPQVIVSATCNTGLPVFTVTNPTPGSPMAQPQAYEVQDESGNVVASGTFELAQGETSETISLPADAAPYAVYTFVSSGAVGTFSVSHGCDAPQISVSASCATTDLPIFTLTNNTPGTPMVQPQAYEVQDENGNVVTSGTFELVQGETTESITLPSSAPPYAPYTFVSSGALGTFSVSHSCDAPQIGVSATCAIHGVPVFTLTNNTPGTPMAQPEAYEIRDANGTVIASSTFELAQGETTELIALPSGAPPYATYTFASSSAVGTLELAHRCEAPVFAADEAAATAVVCASNDVHFLITNPTASDVFGVPYTIKNGDSVVAQGTLTIAAGATQTVTLPAAQNVGGTISLETDASELQVTIETTCGEPVLVIRSTCAAPAFFTITNAGGAMTEARSYTLTSGGVDITPASTSLQLGGGETTHITVPSGTRLSTGVTLRIDGLEPVTSTLRCGGTTVSAVPTVTPESFRFTGLSLVANAPVCAFGCPTFQLYHTDETGDWEIFRLDSANQLERTNVRENLSLGQGEGVVDLAPSLSPETNWIVFQSNRDGNWELYVAPTSGGNPDAVQRLTYNTVAIDSDPMWGPNNFVVYESTRNGNYDLYLIDMSTGAEYRLTDGEGDDINPYWSPDGTRIVFQSDRDSEGRWQLFELNIGTGALRQLSDNDAIEVEPQYSHDGSQIVFRTYDNEGEPGKLVIMNTDGSNRRVISDPNGDATNAAWSPSDELLAYQSDLDGDLDIYIYDVASGENRKLTDNGINDYAPTWRCADERVVFTSDIEDEPNIYEADATPISDPQIRVEEDADQMTFEPANDVYPQSNPSEENASREGQTLLGAFGEQTVFLQPPANVTPIDLSMDGLIREGWNEVIVCGSGN